MMVADLEIGAGNLIDVAFFSVFFPFHIKPLIVEDGFQQFQAFFNVHLGEHRFVIRGELFGHIMKNRIDLFFGQCFLELVHE
jgi:hypothetical protein